MIPVSYFILTWWKEIYQICLSYVSLGPPNQSFLLYGMRCQAWMWVIPDKSIALDYFIPTVSRFEILLRDLHQMD